MMGFFFINIPVKRADFVDNPVNKRIKVFLNCSLTIIIAVHPVYSI